MPRPIPGMVGTKTFVMSYEEGFKITDLEALALHGVDREALMARVVQVYAQCLFVDGFFNADPPLWWRSSHHKGEIRRGSMS